MSIFEYGIISFAIGLLFYIQIAYFLNFFKLFNFFTAFLPFLVLSMLFLLYLYKTNFLINNFNQIKCYWKNNRKEIFNNALILGSIFIIQFLFFWPKVSETLALSAFNDTHRWIKQVLFLQTYGYVNFTEQAIIYPWGFNFFCGGNLLLSPDFTTTYFFIKLAGFPFLNLYTIVFFFVSKRFLKYKSLIFFCLIATFSDVNFLLRSILFLSSTISLLLILISLIILLTKTPNYLLAFTISGSFLINPIYAFFFIIALIAFYMLKIISFKNDKILIFKDMVIILILSFLFVIIYLISCIIYYNLNLNTLIEKVFWVFQEESLNQKISLKYNKIDSNICLFLFNSFISFLLYEVSFSIIELIFYFSTIFILYGLSILSFFIKIKNKNENYKDFILFMKIGLILVLIFLFVPLFFEKNLFTDQFYVRISEAFFPCIILLSGFFIKSVIYPQG